MVMLPSLGRGAGDFDPIAARLSPPAFACCGPSRAASARSTGPAYADLEDCAADIAAVIEDESAGPAFLAGHAFGNRVARLLATDRPDLVRAVSLDRRQRRHGAEPARRARRDPQQRQSGAAATPSGWRRSRFVFFAPGNDPTPWLDGWHPEVLAAQRLAGDQTPRTRDYAGGGKPILYLQPSHDPLAHVEDAENFQRENGDARHGQDRADCQPRRHRRAARLHRRRVDRLRQPTIGVFSSSPLAGEVA